MPRRFWVAFVVLALAAGVLTTVIAPQGDVREAENMSLWQAAILGTVEGLTEYLPVSSTGHLLVAQRALGIGTADAGSKEAADAFAICIQLGAILAVLGLYLGRVRQVVRGVMGRDAAGRQLAGNLLAAFVPAAVLGLAFGDLIKERLFGPWAVVAAWAVGGAAILIVSWRRRGSTAGPAGEGRALEALTMRLALCIGLAQCLAMWPGVSRSLITIVGGVLAGLSVGAAVEFSFLLGVITLGAATVHDGVVHAHRLVDTYSPPSLVVGLCFAFVSAVLAIQWMVRYLHDHGLVVFGWYRLALAAVVAVLLWQGLL